MHTNASDMKNHSHSHQPQATIGAVEPVHPERFAAAQKSTWVSIVINVILTMLQVVGGFLAHSQALMADGLHSLSDLFSDVLVLYANRHGNQQADAEHPYGHARIETAATLILGVFLALLGGVLLVTAAMRLQHPEALQAVSSPALAIAILALIAKEGMFRYMLAVAKRVLSDLEGIAFHEFSYLDVVRHPLVGKIIRAYETAEDAEQDRRAARRGDLQSIPETEGDAGGQATAQPVAQPVTPPGA